MRTSLMTSLLILGSFGCAKKEEPVPITDASTSTISETAAKPETITTDTTKSVPRNDSAAEEPTSTTATAAPPPVEAPRRPVPTKPAPAVGQSSAAEPSKAPPPQTAPTSDTTSSAPAPRVVEPPAPSPTAAPSVAAGGDATEGRAIVKAKCASCHGADGSGKTSMGTRYGLSDFRSDEVQAHSDAELDRILHEGAGKVSASAHKKKALSAEEIGNVVAFIRSLK